VKIVLFMFAGREKNMVVQMPYLYRLLERFTNLEVHLWDLTRTPGDQLYVQGLHGSHLGRVQVLGHLHDGHPIMCLYPNGVPRRRGHPQCTCMNHRPPYEKPYQWYAADTFDQNPPDTIYVKVDDDVLFLETDRFADLIQPVIDHPERVVSANVMNNVVCAKYSVDSMLTANKFSVGDPYYPRNDRRWWALHEDPEFARWCHQRFLARPTRGHCTSPDSPPAYVRTRPGEAVSINCIAFSHQTMKRLATWFANDSRLGDEGAVDRMLPWICTTFHAAHLTFGPQDKRMPPAELDKWRDEYLLLSKEYLG